MKVSDLQRLCEDYLRHNEDVNVMICDDGMRPKYYKAEFAIGSKFDREVKEAKIINNIQIEPPEYKEENIFMIITDLTQEEK